MDLHFTGVLPIFKTVFDVYHDLPPSILLLFNLFVCVCLSVFATILCIVKYKTLMLKV